MDKFQLTLRPFRFRKVSELSRVDLPAPDAPMMANTSPGLTYPEAVDEGHFAKIVDGYKEDDDNLPLSTMTLLGTPLVFLTR
jgi:hypothetical protein